MRLSRDASGAAVMEMHRNGEETAERARRSGPIPAAAATVAVPRAMLDTYAGRYASAVGPIAIAVDENDRLTIQVGPQPPRGLRPTSETEFGVEGVDARVVFHRDNGAVARLIIHQSGCELVATREAAPAS